MDVRPGCKEIVVAYKYATENATVREELPELANVGRGRNVTRYSAFRTRAGAKRPVPWSAQSPAFSSARRN